MKNYYNFRTALRYDLSYQSKIKDKSIFPNFFFYLRVFVAILQGAWLAKKRKFNESTWAETSLKMIEAAEAVGGQFYINGLQNISKTFNRPVVFMANHMSTLENFCLPVILLSFKNITFVVKKELLTYPIFGHIMKATNPVALNRLNPREDLQTMMADCSKKLKQGISIIIFPQHTRRDKIIPSQFNSIAVKIATANNVPIIPIALKTDFWANGKRLKDFGKINPNKKIHIAFGQPIKMSTNPSAAEQKITHNQAVDFIVACHKQWQ
ncbi:1-acyl-sn-glycerol-3-phosphate acyltransferase [Patescibacteria group bacterium]|nr:1-acyl-sn-glycerol-3-phosphate acyltransferase [Patescibacteria group bacterium]